MLIDWFTVGAQAVNFLILVWLLKRFFYRPILNAINVREQKIAKELADAAFKMTEAETERAEFKRKNDELEKQRAGFIKAAIDEAKTEYQRLLDEARQTADVLSARRQETLRNDANTLSQAVRRRTQQEVFSIARKALDDLAGTSLEERMIEVFTRRLHEMDEQMKADFAKALKAASSPARVRSTFVLSDAQCGALQQLLKDTFSVQTPIHFEVTPNLVCGIEFTASGQKLAWSIANYILELEKSVRELLREKVNPETPAEPIPEDK
jgi:F-type H+-transporting ATPase subunit b